jgi:predicted nuclease with TOPRIM domain
MLNVEQVKLLETKVENAIKYIEKLMRENAALVSEKAGLQSKLNANQKRIDELELIVMNFKTDQGRIEDGILAALDRLSQFEKAVEKSLKDKPDIKKTPVKTQPVKAPSKPSEPRQSNSEIFFEIPEKATEEDPDILNGDSHTDNDLDIF